MQDGKLGVMQIVGDLEIGGAQQVVYTLVKHLASHNCQPIVCTLKDGPIRSAIEQLGIKVYVLPQRRYSILALPLFITDLMRIWKSFAQLVAEHNVLVVQTHILGSLDFLAMFLRYTTRVRIVLWTFHSTNFELTVDMLPKHRWLFLPKKYGLRLLYRLASRLVSGLVAVSDQVQTQIVETIRPPRDRVHTIRNGVDTALYEHDAQGASSTRSSVRSELGLTADAFLIATVGRLEEPKGHRYLIAATEAVVSRSPGMHVLLIGDGELREELQEQVNKLELGDRVHFLGSRLDVPRLLEASDLFVLPSLWEGLPMALLEAMASGKPSVATAVSGTKLVMIPHETGLLVPPRDAQKLAEAILELVADPERAKAMGLAARQRVLREFSARKQADEHLAVYRRLLASQGVSLAPTNVNGPGS
jgi:glycosyltransferase involved in cell wall biosynthesis